MHILQELMNEKIGLYVRSIRKSYKGTKLCKAKPVWGLTGSRIGVPGALRRPDSQSRLIDNLMSE